MFVCEVENYKLMSVLPKWVAEKILCLVKNNPSRSETIKDILISLNGVDFNSVKRNAFMQINGKTGETFIETFQYLKSDSRCNYLCELKVISNELKNFSLQQILTPLTDKKLTHKIEIIELSFDLDSNECCYTNSKTCRTSNFKLSKAQENFECDGEKEI